VEELREGPVDGVTDLVTHCEGRRAGLPYPPWSSGPSAAVREAACVRRARDSHASCAQACRSALFGALSRSLVAGVDVWSTTKK
jgi:hypothetical protein